MIPRWPKRFKYGPMIVEKDARWLVYGPNMTPRWTQHGTKMLPNVVFLKAWNDDQTQTLRNIVFMVPRLFKKPKYGPNMVHVSKMSQDGKDQYGSKIVP